VRFQLADVCFMPTSISLKHPYPLYPADLLAALFFCRFLKSQIARLLQLLPSANATQLLLDSAADLDLPPEVLALQYQELDMVFQNTLGSHITAKPFHYLLTRLRLSSSNSSSSSKQQQQQIGTSSAFQQVLQTSAGLCQQLQQFADILGPELAHSALQETPQVLDASLDRAQANLRWLQQQLRLSPVAAMLLAGNCGQLLLLPIEQLAANYASLRYLLQQLLGWRQQQLHSALCNVPQLLVMQPQQCAGAWQRVQQLARRRIAWLQELSAAEAPLVTSVLTAQRMQLMMLQYAGDTGDLAGRSLNQVLQLQYVDFVSKCPGFCTWRAMAPGRWRFEAVRTAGRDGSGLQDSSSAAGIAGEGAAAATEAIDEASGFCSRNRGAALGGELQRRVLAEDASGRPVLVSVGGPLGPFDRLA
jgi:hypothetical protein